MKRCEICGKGRKKAVKRKKLRGQYNPVKTYFQKPNIQILNINGKKLEVCKECRKLILKGKIKV
ncbi:MAG: hypothetical protein RQ894_00525 [Candidatus Pacebacteria bacterium]|jgi:ribosome-binding protein aMBF1 (putative translation factor)|nr:hypothetical protein [Candidatus Paceibacterota bacterium]